MLTQYPILALTIIKDVLLSTDVLVAVCTSAVLFAVSIWKKALTLSAALLACAMMLCISICSSYKEVIFLMLSYMIIVAIDLLCKNKAESRVHDVHKKTGARTVSQVLANGSFAVIATILLRITKDKAFLYAYIICVSEACADSIASDIGVLAKKPPISILTFKQVDTGISGGISLLGMMSSLIGCIVIAFLSCYSLGFSFRILATVTLLPYVGMLIDSMLGAGLQGKYRCAVCGKNTERSEHCSTPTEHIGGLKLMDNSVINAVTNIITGVLGYIIVKAFII